jgi:hypothetical protein
LRYSGAYLLGPFTPADILDFQAELLRSEGVEPPWLAPVAAPADAS